MHPKVVLVVSRSYWRCVSCKLLNRQTMSIDQHLQSAHPHLAFSSSQTSGTGSGNMYCYSDGELDTTFPCKEILPLRPLTSGVQKNQLLKKKPQLQRPVVTESLRQFRRRQKRTSTKKIPLVHSTKNSQKADNIVTSSDIFHRDLDEDCVPNDGNIDYDDTAEEKTNRKKSVRKPHPIPKTKLAHSRVKHWHNNGSRKPTKMKVTLKDHSEQKRTEQLYIQQEKTHGEECVDIKEKIPTDSTEKEITDTLKEGKCARMKNVKLSGKGEAKKSSRQVDKSNIATCCVPWLLDSGRKAGDKVTKISRRTLLPEEKQAVRELYGIYLYDQTTDMHTQNLDIPGETIRQFNMEAQSLNTEENGVSRQPNLNLLQRAPHEEGAATLHRSFLMNMFSQGTREFFMDSSRFHENLYPSYGCMYNQQQQQQQHSLYASHASEFYSSAHNVPSQRSDLMNLQLYNQSAPPVLSAPTVGEPCRLQVGGGGYLGQGGNMANLPHPHVAPGPVICAPATISATTPPLVVTSYDVNADSTVSVPHAVIPAADFNIKSDPSSLQQATITISVPENVAKVATVVEENPCNHCDVCKQTFESASKFEKHKSNVSDFDSVECKRCRCVFHGLHELNLHVFSLHETEKQAFCFTCDEDISGIENLEKHAHKHAYHCERQLVDMRFHDCRLCGEELPSTYSTIRTHYYQHHVTHVCSECFQYFSDIQVYKEHSRTHNGKPFLCSICGSRFDSVQDFDGHAPCPEDIWAEDGKGDQCVKCGLWCPNRAVVEAHRKQHRSQDDVEAYRQGAKIGFPCASCEKVFKNKHACRRHTKMVHEGVSCYKHYCEYCGKGFLTKGHMRDHIALHHLKIKRYSCDYCNQQFVCAPTLRRHVRKEHTKHKPYECQHCGERFFEKTPLQRHLTKHTGLAPFMCEHCGKGFYTKHSFTNHGSTHSSVKEFVCSGCQKGFTRKYNLQAHIKICKML